MTIEIAGMAHVQLTVNDLERAKEFYEKLLGYLGMRPVMKFPGGLYMVGGRTAVMITQSSEENRQARFDQRRIGLHHLCFRARSREDIDELHAFLVRDGVEDVVAGRPGGRLQKGQGGSIDIRDELRDDRGSRARRPGCESFLVKEAR